MQQTPFHAYYAARTLANLSCDELLLPVFASSDIKVYPFQIAAAGFALRSPYQKGVILCDEAGMGKSHEAMLIMAQRWMEGHTKILLCIPNADLLCQWTKLLDRHYTVPYVVLTNAREWNECTNADNSNGFEQFGIVITTYDFAAEHEADATSIPWDLVAFEEANVLSSVYQDGSKQAKTLHRIAGNAFKLLLTGTPIEKNIMDLYGLIWFIDDTILPDEREFLARYLRKPENYPELAERVSKYCFRTLRSQAKGYAKIPERVLLTVEYLPSNEEQHLYDRLYAYINKPNKLAFPEMETYDLALRLLSLQSSSTAAIAQTLKGVIKRLGAMEQAQDEIAELQTILDICNTIQTDTKAKELLRVLEKGFSLLRKSGAPKKAVVFTESVETQKMLLALIGAKYKTVVYNGTADYSAIRQFKQDGEVLISTDNGAKGFNLESASFVVHYDLLYNTLKMEQRIDRCHRIGQENDVLSVAFINQNNFADVRKLELVSKRTLVSDGVFGISDDIIGGFTNDLSGAFEVLAAQFRTKAQVEADYQKILKARTTENKQLLASAEDVLFTTFTKELADHIRLTPQYIDERTKELNASLWELAKWFFARYNENHTDCYYVIDDEMKTITATNYETLPTLFYYWDGSRNKKYQSQKQYGMAADFKPRYGRITLTSIIGRGIIHELECPDSGVLTVQSDTAPYTIGLYHITLFSGKRSVAEHSILVGKNESGEILTAEQCLALLSKPVLQFSQSEHAAPHWLKSGSTAHALDRFVPVEELIATQMQRFSPIYQEELARLKLHTAAKKVGLAKEIDILENRLQKLEAERESITNDRLRLLAMDKQINQLRREYKSKQESQFFDAMRLDLELEEQVKAFSEKEKLTAKVVREFVVQVTGNR